MTESLRHTPLHDQHVRLGARLVPFAGWSMPVQYQGISAEHRAVRERVGIFDVSHMGELWLEGPGAVALVDGLITNDLTGAAPGRAVYTCCCRDDGGILDDLIVYRAGEERVLVVCNASNHAKIAAHFEEAARGRCAFRDASSETALLALQGPRAFEVLAALAGGGELSTLGSFRFRDATLEGIACMVARTGYTGEDGVELFCTFAEAPALWEHLLRAGAPHGISPAGLGARDTLRLEARLSLYGNELDEQTHPLEAGLGWTVKLSKSTFVGKAALVAAAAAPPRRVLVGFEVTGRGVARHGYPLLDVGGQPVGVCTSGAPSPTLGKSIGLGWLPPAMAEIGSTFAVDCRGKAVEAVVVPTPFYRRPRA